MFRRDDQLVHVAGETVFNMRRLRLVGFQADNYHSVLTFLTISFGETGIMENGETLDITGADLSEFIKTGFSAGYDEKRL